MREIVQTPGGARFADELDDGLGDRRLYLDLIRIAERDLTGEALERRTEEVLEMARADGWEIPTDFEADTPARQFYDRFNRDSKLAATAGIDGCPSILPRGQLDFWQSAVKDAPVDPSITEEILAPIRTWLQSAAAPQQGAELLGLAQRSALIATALAAYAAAGKRYLDSRPA